MASETNELTFVRCPTCRSLVPASASKCRICNAALDAGSKAATGDSAPPSGGRVRQKTVAAGAEEVKGMVASKPAPAAPPAPAIDAPPAAANSAAAAASRDDDMFDPLGAFLQDLDAAPEKSEEQSIAPVEPIPTKTVAPAVDLFADDDDSDDELDDEDLDDLDDFDLDIFDDPSLDELEDLDEQEKVSEPVESKMSDPVEDLLEDPVEDLVEDPVEDFQTEARSFKQDPVEEPRVVEKQPAQPIPAARTPQTPIRPRIGGMPKRPESKPAAKPEVRPVQEPAQVASRPAERREAPVRPQQPVQQRPEVRRSAVPSVAPVAANVVAAAERRKPEVAVQAKPQNRPVAERAVEASVESTGARPNKMKPGRLFGWLVSYENPDGRAIELRAGRFFVTGTSIRGTDLIIEDQSISTPHALMSITENGLQLQDLMSERGTFVRAQGEAQYRREDGVIEVRHGDWVRFGDVEFLVTVVPS